LSFGRWLSSQKVRDDWIGDLARAAARDRRFPWSAEPLDIFDHVRRHMGGEDATVLHAVQAALDEWNEGPFSLWEAQKARRDAKHAAAVEAKQIEEERAAAAERARRNARRKELRARRANARG